MKTMDKLKNKYKWVEVKNHPTYKSKRMREHRYLAEKHLLNEENSIIVNGVRILKKDYVVHHIDGDKTNNNLSNLVVLSKSEHTRLHNLEAPRKRCQKTGRFISKKGNDINE